MLFRSLLPFELCQRIENLRAHHLVHRRVGRLAMQRVDARHAHERKQCFDLERGILFSQRAIRPRRHRLMLDRRARRPADETIGIVQFRPRGLQRLRVRLAVESFQCMTLRADFRACNNDRTNNRLNIVYSKKVYYYYIIDNYNSKIIENHTCP